MSLMDSRGRVLMIGARVRANFRCGVETHGLVVDMQHHDKHGTVLLIEDFDSGHLNHLPHVQCKRMYGHTERSKAALARRARPNP